MLDVLIIIFCFTSLARGYRIGLVRQAGSTAGFVVGLFIGSYLSNHIIDNISSQASRSLTSLLIVLGVSLLFMTIGEMFGLKLKARLVRSGSLDRLDGSLGSAMSVVTLLLAVWLAASILLISPAGGVQTFVKRSRIVAALNRNLPPATELLGTLNKLIDPNGFPQVFTGLEPSPNTTANLPSLGSLNAVVTAAQPSVVKLAGTGCGGIVEGSGFVISGNRVVTNAHVVAGVGSPKVIDGSGVHNATVVLFDKDTDLAILKVSGLAGKPLEINLQNQPAGTAGVVLGYPGGAGFDAQPASVMDRFIAAGRDIYGQGLTRRQVYSLQAKVIPGNSGGPLLNKDGQVIAVVFATSTEYSNVGYALTTQQVSGDLSASANLSQAVGTGACSE